MSGDWKQALDRSIREWEARPQFGALTPEVLAAVPDDLLEQAVVDFVLNFRAWPADRLLALLARLPSGFATVYTTWMLDAEIANGGFHQYFWNTDGRYAALVREALHHLRVSEHLDAFERAAALADLRGGPDVARKPARAQLQAFSDSALEGAFDRFDARWHELGDLGAARIRFIRGNPGALTARLPPFSRARLKLAGLWRRRRARA